MACFPQYQPRACFLMFLGFYLLPQHAGANPEIVENTPSLLIQAILSREKKDRFVCLLHPTLSCKAMNWHVRLLLSEREQHLNKINTLGSGYANSSPTQALLTVRGFHTDAINGSHCLLTAQRGTGDQDHPLAYFRCSGHPMLLPPWIFFPLYYGSLCITGKSSYLVHSSILMSPLMPRTYSHK